MANIIISPSKYVQGKGELANIAQYDANLFLKHSMESVLRTRLTVW